MPACEKGVPQPAQAKDLMLQCGRHCPRAFVRVG
jgi:hypothetical protein